MKVNKSFSLSLDTAERLADEPNQSEVVEDALQEYWDDE